jgi:3-hydroxyisobutyrate dehydrogenase-like beta-hydroxyacid dehydrogenase
MIARDAGMRVAWVGLGVMGYPMAGHLVTRGGLDVTVYNRTAAKAEKWSETFKGPARPTPAEAARDADFVFACVGNDDDLRQVTVGPDGCFHTMKPGAVFVDHTTASALWRASFIKPQRRKGWASSMRRSRAGRRERRMACSP